MRRDVRENISHILSGYYCGAVPTLSKAWSSVYACVCVMYSIMVYLTICQSGPSCMWDQCAASGSLQSFSSSHLSSHSSLKCSAVPHSVLTVLLSLPPPILLTLLLPSVSFRISFCYCISKVLSRQPSPHCDHTKELLVQYLSLKSTVYAYTYIQEKHIK